MTTMLDGQIGFKKETVFGTAVTVDSFVEANTEDFKPELTYKVSKGLRVGQRVQYADRRVLVKSNITGSFTTDVYSKGLGKLIEAAFGGTGTSTLIAGSAYQQLFVPTTTDFLNSYTVQVGIPPLGGGAVLPHTYTGNVCTGFELTAPNGDVPTIKFNWQGKTLDTATALATATYATVEPLSFIGGSIGLGGTMVVPTNTALASGVTASTNIVDASFVWDNALDSGGWNFGSTGARTRKSALGMRTGTGSLTVEYTDNTLRDAYIAGTSLPLTLTYASPTLISGSSFPTFQIAIPAIKLNGEVPAISAPGEVITQKIDFEVYDNRAASSPIYVAIVTAETAI